METMIPWRIESEVHDKTFIVFISSNPLRSLLKFEKLMICDQAAAAIASSHFASLVSLSVLATSICRLPRRRINVPITLLRNLQVHNRLRGSGISPGQIVVLDIRDPLGQHG